MRKVIKRISDHVPDVPPQILNTEESNASQNSPPPGLAISSILDLQDKPEFVEWFISVAWTRDMLQDAWT